MDENIVEDKFRAAVNIIQHFPKNGLLSTTNAEKLQFYALYKQATIGSCNISSPSFWNIIEKQKWLAWQSLTDMEQCVAKQKYIAKLCNILDDVKYRNDFILAIKDCDDVYKDKLEKSLTLLSYDAKSSINKSEKKEKICNSENKISRKIYNSVSSDEEEYYDAKEYSEAFEFEQWQNSGQHLRSINENKKTRRNISNMKSDEKTISSLNRKSVGNCRSVDYIAFIREKINKISSLMRYIRSESKWKSNWIYMSWRILVFFFIAPILIRISYSYIPFKTALLI